MAQIPHADDDGMVCPFHKKKMADVCHKCPLWMSMRGKDPNTGEDIDKWGCSFAWLPFMMMENAKQIRANAAATESFRNEVVGVGNKIVQVTAQKASGGLNGNFIQPRST